jgi:predicted dehydrogenase
MPQTTHADALRVALLGFGLGGAAFHAPLIASTAGLRLTTIVTGDAGRRQQALAQHPGVEVVPDPQCVWDRAADHDLVVISTANRTHVPLALAALQAGLPVVVDKPFAPTVAQAREVFEVAAARGLSATAYHNRRWDSECLTVRKLLRGESLGRVLRLESRLERWRPQAKGGWRELPDAADAGGLLYDLGTHLIDQALFLLGPVTEVYAEIESRRAGLQVDDDVFIALKHRSGVRSHLWTSYLAAQRGPRMRVLGDRAAFVKQEADLQEAALRTGKRPDEVGAEWGREPPEHWGVLTDGAQERRVESEPGAYQSFYAQMHGWLRGTAAQPVVPQDVITGLQIIEAARRSAAQRVVVSIDS